MKRSHRMLIVVLVWVLLLSAGPIEVLQLSLPPEGVQVQLKNLGEPAVAFAQEPESTPHEAAPAPDDAGPSPDQPIEIPELRTQNSKTFLNLDGTYSVHIWAATVHYLDAEGRWQEVDNRLVTSAASGYAFENAANRFKVRFAQADAQDPSPGSGQALVRFELADQWVTMTPTGPLRAVAPAVTDNRITYAGLLDGLDLEYQVGADGVKENVILAAPPRQNTFTFLMRVSDGVRLEQLPDGSVDFYDAASGDYLWSLAAPYMFDSTPSLRSGQALMPEGYAPVQMELAGRGQSGVYHLTLMADPAWLADPARVYPVTIDPWIVIRPAAADTTLFSDGGANSNWGWAGFLAVGYNASGLWKARTLMRFDLSAIPPRSTILEAYLALFVDMQINPTTHNETLHQVTRGWTETGATWNKYDGVNPWTTPGGDYNATPEWSTSIGTLGSGSEVRWYLTDLVHKWYSGEVPNYGLLIKSQNETINTVDYYYSSNYSDQTKQPVLAVEYVPWLGVQDFWQYVEMDLGGGLTQKVNVANGNLILQKEDLAIPGVELDNVLVRTYNSLIQAWVYDLNNWKLSTGPDLFLDDFTGDSSVIWVDFTGTQIRFAKNADGSFTSPPGIHYTLEYVNGVYKLRDRRGVTYTFQASAGVYRLTSSVTDRNNNTLTYSYDANGRLTSITDTVGRVTTVSYNAQGYIASITDNAGRQIQYNYNANGRLSSVTDSAGQVTTYTYDANLRLASVRDPRNNTTQYAYDSSGRVTTITDALGKTTTFTYNSDNTVVTDANNRSTTYTYDVYGRVTSVQDARNNTTQYQYDADHNVTRVTDPAGKVTTFNYDSLYRPTSVTDPLNLTETATYADGNNPYYPTTLTDPRNKQTNYGYSPTGNLTSAQAPSLPQATFTYNANGTVATMTDPKGYVTSYQYDAQGNLTRIIDPLNRVTQMGYDSVSRRTSLLDAKSQTTGYQYDNVNRLTRVTYHDGTYVSFTYDGNGNLTQMVDPTGTTSYEYDARNRLTRKTLPDGTQITFTYDNVGNLASMTDAGGTVSHTYNEVNLVSTVTEPGGYVTSFTYDNRNRVTQIAYPSGVAIYKDWDDGGKLTRIRALKSGVTLVSFTYDYVNPATGQVTELRYKVTDKDGNYTTYTYDDAGRLTSAVTRNSSGTITDNRSWVLDANSNWTSHTANGTTVNYSYDAANQLVWASGLSYTWDANGNLTSGGGKTYTYNAADQTISISGVTMGYTGLGQTERVTRGSYSYKYNTLGIGPGLERDGSGVFTYYTRTPDGGLLGFRRNGARYYYLVDGLGSVMGVTNSSGSVINTYRYDPYGAIQYSSEQVAQPYRFASVYYDTNLSRYKMGGRYYEPSVGRFTQRDPEPGSAYEPLSYNRYVYVADNPVNYTDEDGLRRRRINWGRVIGGGIMVGAGVFVAAAGAIAIGAGLAELAAIPATAGISGLVGIHSMAVGGMMVSFGVGSVGLGFHTIWRGISYEPVRRYRGR